MSGVLAYGVLTFLYLLMLVVFLSTIAYILMSLISISRYLSIDKKGNISIGRELGLDSEGFTPFRNMAYTQSGVYQGRGIKIACVDQRLSGYFLCISARFREPIKKLPSDYDWITPFTKREELLSEVQWDDKSVEIFDELYASDSEIIGLIKRRGCFFNPLKEIKPYPKEDIRKALKIILELAEIKGKMMKKH